MTIFEIINNAKKEYARENKKDPTHLFIGKDIQYLLDVFFEDYNKKERKTPWRLMKLFGMQIVPVNTEMHFSIGYCHSIMYDI